MWRDGLKHGKGVMNWSTGEVYMGEYYFGNREGYGRYQYIDGRVYIGYWKGDIINGYVYIYIYIYIGYMHLEEWIEI